MPPHPRSAPYLALRAAVRDESPGACMTADSIAAAARLDIKSTQAILSKLVYFNKLWSVTTIVPGHALRTTFFGLGAPGCESNRAFHAALAAGLEPLIIDAPDAADAAAAKGAA